MKCLRSSRQFLLGIVATLIVVSLAGTASAATNGQVSFNQIGIRLFGESKVTAGESYKAPNGQEVPSVITYTDEAGGKTNYLSVKQLSELLDAEVSWNSETNSVDFATYSGTAAGTSTDSFTWEIISHDEDGDTLLSPYPDKAELGVKHGAFTEVDPSAVNTSADPTSILLQDTHITADLIGFPDMAYTFLPAVGKHVFFQVTNNGDKPQAVTVARVKAISNDRMELFTTVTANPGQTVTRAFSVSPESTNGLDATLQFRVTPIDRSSNTDITVSLMQYQ